jgi:hypothetical protein
MEIKRESAAGFQRHFCSNRMFMFIYGRKSVGTNVATWANFKVMTPEADGTKKQQYQIYK